MEVTGIWFNINRKTAIAVEVGAGSAVTVSELQSQLSVDKIKTNINAYKQTSNLFNIQLTFFFSPNILSSYFIPKSE